MTTHNIEISAQPTPNPNTLKFTVNKVLLESGTADFPTRESAQGSPLAEKLLEHDHITGVFVGANFVTVTKDPSARWDFLVTSLVQTLKDVLSQEITFVANTNVAKGSSENEIEQKIREILDAEIRPAVAMDGGDITFHSYHEGIVTLHLRGACSHCPASAMTLKMGVENRLKELIPEVKEVIQV